MSTDYYPFLCGISSVRITKGPGHDRIEVWQRGGKCGELVVDLGTGQAIAKLFCNDVHVLHSHYGGIDKGVIVEKTPSFNEETIGPYVLSEYGELVTVDELLKLVTS